MDDGYYGTSRVTEGGEAMSYAYVDPERNLQQAPIMAGRPSLSKRSRLEVQGRTTICLTRSFLKTYVNPN